MITTQANIKFNKKVPPHVQEKANKVVAEHMANTLSFQKAVNGLYWHYTLPQYYKVIYHKDGDYYRVMSGQDYAKYQKTYCR
ncbi:MAG: hypothetical protein ACRC6V_09865 [Bacteroidales bacterium]